METDLHCDTLGHVQRKAPINTLAEALELAKPKHLAATPGEVETEASFDDSLNDVEAHAQADTMAVTLKEANAYALLPDTT